MAFTHTIFAPNLDDIYNRTGERNIDARGKMENYLKYRTQTKAERYTAIFVQALIGLAIGFVNGYLGAGGGMLLVPALTLVVGLSEKEAHATAIAVILPLCAVSAGIYGAEGALSNTPIAVVIGGVTAGGIVGACLLKKLNPKVLAIAFYLLMIAAGLKMLF